MLKNIKEMNEQEKRSVMSLQWVPCQVEHSEQGKEWSLRAVSFIVTM